MKVSLNKINEILDVSMDDIQEIPKEELDRELQATGLSGQNMVDNQSLEKEPDNRKRANTKRNVINQSANKGANA
jgi:hypothetical protein